MPRSRWNVQFEAFEESNPITLTQEFIYSINMDSGPSFPVSLTVGDIVFQQPVGTTLDGIKNVG